MNLQQLQSADPNSRLLFAEPGLKPSYKPLMQPVAGLQTRQVVTAAVARIAEPATIKDLRSLREEERGTDSPIAPRAFLMAMDLLEFVHRVFGDLPRTVLVPSGEGGITIEWFRDERTVRAIIPPIRPDQDGYVYQRVGRESDIKPFSKSSVIQTLRSIILTP